jgi:short-subunit dehydrogenase
VTGASAGIGQEFAKQLAQEHINVILVARRKDAMDKLADELKTSYGIQAETIACDLGTREGPYELHKELQHRNLNKDLGLFINNAGYGWFGEFETQDLAAVENMIQLNVTSVAVLTKLVLADLVQRKQRGGVVITSSLGAFIPGPLSALYTSTKAFDRFLAVSVHREQQNKPADRTQVDFLSLEPGSTSTEFSQVAGSRGDLQRTSPSFVVDKALDHLLARYPSLIPSDKDHFSTWFTLLPYAITTPILYNAFKNLMGKSH